MHRQGRRPSWGLRALSVLGLLAALLTTGPAFPQIALASQTNPVPPSNVRATGGDRSLLVAWDAAPEAPWISRYDVYFEGSPTPVTSSTTTSVTIGGLTNGQTYTVRVKTVTTSLLGTMYTNGALSEPASGVPADGRPPVPPTGVTAVRGDGKVTLTWVPNGTDADVDGYRVLRGDGQTTGFLPGAGLAEWVDTTVVNDTTYSYTVQAQDTSLQWSVSSSPAVSATPTDLTPPAPPTGVVGGVGDGRAGLAWDAGPEPDLAGYRVFRNGVLIATVTATSHLDEGLTNDTTYSYTVVAVDTHGNASGPSAAVPVTPTDLTAPASPTGLVAVRGDGRVDLSWTANGEPDVASYRVLRDGVEIATVTSGTAYADTGLVNDRTYVYRLAAVDGHGNRSVSSSPVSATPTDLGAPATPTGLTATRGDGQVVLSWTANAESDLASYRVLRDGAEIATVTSGTTFTDTGLTNDTTYGYRLVAVDTHDNRSAPSAAVGATPTDLTAPAAPSGLVATGGDRQVVLSWTANGESDLASYRVLRDGAEIATVTVGTTFTDTGLTNDTTYGYRLVAVDTHGNRSTPSVAATATPSDTTAPAAPAGLAAMRGDGRVTLSWTANGEPDVASYRVLRNGVEIATVPSGTAYTDTGLTNDTAYSYRLVAVDTSGNRSPASSAVSATPTDLTPPAAPTGLVATRGNGQVSLTWTANTEPDLSGYRVIRDGVEIASVTGTTYTDAGRANGTVYTYTIVAVDTHGNRSTASAPTSTAVDVTPPAAPTGLAATRGDGRVTLSWSANREPDFATYRVLRNGTEIATVTARSYVDTGLVNDTTYSYTLVAVDDTGNRSAASAPVTATPTDLIAPAAPTGLTAVAGERRVVLSWTANAEPDVGTYVVLRDGVEVMTLTGTSWTDSGLTNDVTYSYTLVAVDTHGNRSGASAAVAATPRDGAPAAPTAVTATPGDRRATIGWTAPADPDVVTYRVLAEDGRVVATATAPATSAVVGGLTNGTSYRFTVVAVDAGGNVSAPSGSVTVVPVSPTVPTGGSGESGGVAASSDGRYVVIGTRAQREASDTNTAYELYVLDRTAGTARRIVPLSASATGATDPTNTAAPSISDDGRYVALATTAALVPADTNGQSDVYRIDLTTGTRVLVSVPPSGGVNASTAGTVLQTGSSVYATTPPVVVSGDGDLVLFYSARSDLVTGDTNASVDLFAKRLSTGAVTRVSTTATGASLPGAAMGPALDLTPDGRFALFPAGSPTGATMLYRKTLSGTGAGELVLVSSVGPAGRTTSFPVFRDAGDISISADGRYVALVTAARITTATPGSMGSVGLAYRLDTATGAVLSLGDGQQLDFEHKVELDPTGRYAFFSTAAAALPADVNGHTDHYRRDLGGGAAGPLVLVTSDAAGAVTGGPIGSVAPTEYGRLFAPSADQVLVTTSQALVSADTNRLRDLYAKDLISGVVSSPVG